MQHLGVLERAQLIIVRRSGRQRWNLHQPATHQADHDRWISQYANGAVDFRARMKKQMEQE